MPHGDTPHAHVRLMERNLAGHFSYLQRATEGMAVQERDGHVLVRSGLGFRPACEFTVYEKPAPKRPTSQQ